MNSPEIGRIRSNRSLKKPFSVVGVVSPEVLLSYCATLPKDDPRYEGTHKAMTWINTKVEHFLGKGGAFLATGERIFDNLTMVKERVPRFYERIQHEGVIQLRAAQLRRELNTKKIDVNGRTLPDKTGIFYSAENLQDRLFYACHPLGRINYLMFPHPDFPRTEILKGNQLAELFERYASSRFKGKGMQMLFSTKEMVNSALLAQTRPIRDYRPLEI